jgi:hypothetical protein
MTSILPPIQSVLELFKGPLSSVRFADVDAAGLANLAAEVEAAASELQQHEEKLVELRQSVAQRQEALLVLAQRALAYARVYAETDEPLLQELNRISLPRAAKPRKAGAIKSSGAGDAARAEGAEGAAESSTQTTVGGAEPAPAELTGPDSENAPRRRAARKARGSVPQPATN